LITSGAMVKNCIVEDYTRVGKHANLESKIIFGNKCINPELETHFDVVEANIEFLIDDVRKPISDSVFDLDSILLEQ
jgi:mannose-1-phosphate guanylyltransferase